MGKTTAKEATSKILQNRFKTLASAKSLNSEFGVALTLLEEESGFSNPLKWLAILFRAEWRSFTKIEAKKIILELGVDAPGDFRKLLKMVKPQIGVFLNVAPVHLAHGQFRNVEEIAREKSLLIENLPKSGMAILNADDEFTRTVKTKAKKIFFGFSAKADLRATEIRESIKGISAKITWRKETIRLQIPILGRANLYSLLSAIAVGIASGVGLKKSAAALADFHLPPGRLNLFEGIRGSKIIDGSYNSNPTSLGAALETLGKLKTSGRKIVVLGQMNELGENSKKLHHELGKKAAKVADEVIGVFGDAKIFTTEAKRAKKKIKFFAKAGATGEWLKKELKKNDLVLMKGSQNNVRLERAIAKVLANPEDKKLLCRQEKAWKRR